MKTSRRRSALAKALLACLLSIAVVLTQETALAAQNKSENKHAVAVIIGNQIYQHQDVPSVDFAHNDADAMKRFVIGNLGYREGNVIDLRDATQAQMVSTFGNSGNHKGKLWSWLRGDLSDVTVFYSGHGVPGDGKGYLLPVDADPETADLNGYPIEVLYKNLAKLPAKSVTVYLDACFSGQTPKGSLMRAASGIMPEPRPPKTAKGLTVVTAARGDQMASWDEEAKHGLFTRFLLEALWGAADKGDFGNGDGTVSLGEVQRYLNEEMTYAAKRRYRRTQTVTVSGDEAVTLAAVTAGVPSQVASIAPAAPSPRPSFAITSLDQRMFVSGASLLNVRALPGGQAVGKFKSGEGGEVTGWTEHEGARWYRVAMAGGGAGFVFGEYLTDKLASPVQPAVGVYPKPAAPASTPGSVFKDCSDCPEMVVVPSGSFMMGSPSSELERGRGEGPVHRVKIPTAFAVGKYEVTFEEWDACVSSGGCRAYRPADEGWGRGRRPVINVSWDDAKSYVEWLSRETGKAYRLPSESEWEYVARAGTMTAFYTGARITASEANFNGRLTYNGSSTGEDRRRTIPVGSFGPNQFGLHDVHGNVWEWVEDCWNGSYSGAPVDGEANTTGDCSRRVLRGGSWFSRPRNLRSAIRNRFRIGYRSSFFGFRVARTLTR